MHILVELTQGDAELLLELLVARHEAHLTLRRLGATEPVFRPAAEGNVETRVPDCTSFGPDVAKQGLKEIGSAGEPRLILVALLEREDGVFLHVRQSAHDDLAIFRTVPVRQRLIDLVQLATVVDDVHRRKRRDSTDHVVTEDLSVELVRHCVLLGWRFRICTNGMRPQCTYILYYTLYLFVK